ncbi:hypothetical protein P3T36_001176 [Kitasatospora sp. MAP12-15]|uniref:MFS transporter n=1 Tax=unclassified Kitasatospora TaxID=2633591 RepID=UPI002474F05D|nr:MFS transporter [Kitasatospora sp. MAP12-44]MDH6114825.1 hypothetical protein [Kitasatospora sp. MAP12-44]
MSSLVSPIGTGSNRTGAWSRQARAALHRPVVAATLLALVLHLLWALFLARNAGDLAAQYAWTDFIRKNPDSSYNLSWYGGMYTVSYSVLSPYVMGLLGVRTTGVIAGTLTAALAARLLERSPLSRPMAPALWTAFAMWCNAASGRVTFALGCAAGLAAVMLLFPEAPRRAGRTAAVAALATLATLSSPVAGLFLGVAAAALFLTGRRRESYALVLGPILVIAGTSLLFPFYGVQPFDWYVALPIAAASALLAALMPRQWRVMRLGAAVYAVGVLLTWMVPSPIGSNVERLLLLFGGAALLAAVLDPGTHPAGATGWGAALSGWRRVTLGVVFLAVAGWQIATPVGDLISTVPAPASALPAASIVSELHRVGADRGRIEVVPLRSHWESSALAPYVDLARGWNRQADVSRNPLFYTDTPLSPAAYHAWLQRWGVGYVLLPPDRPDDAAVDEAHIVAAGYPWLSLVWGDENWRLYRVTDATPLVAAPATVTQATAAALTLEVPYAGPVLLRIPWSPWLGVRGSDQASRGCLAESGGWTMLYAPEPGTYQVAGRYSLNPSSPCAHG